MARRKVTRRSRKKSRKKGAAAKSNKRPLKFLKSMHSKMKVNIVKLDRIIKQREAAR